MRKTLIAFALVLALCCPAFAGVISCPPIAPPPSAPTEAATTNGDMHFPLAEIALTLFSLF